LGTTLYLFNKKYAIHVDSSHIHEIIDVFYCF